MSVCKLFAQPSNDECDFATFIPSTDKYCSNGFIFTNVGATPDPIANHSCISPKFQNGVWFSFVAKEPSVLINVYGVSTNSSQGGTLRGPKILLYEECNKYLACSPGKDNGTDEFLFDELILGQIYYIMVESNVGGEGTFQLCIDDFVPVPSPESDCPKAVVLCDKSSFIVQSLTGNGALANEVTNTCIEQEFQSSWYKWTCDKSGSLTFTLTPNNTKFGGETDDLDFAVYELPSGLDICNNKKLIRCEAAGANTTATGAPAPLSQWAACNGPTGLSLTENDVTEQPGCVNGNNNFVKAIDMESGKSYALIVNNFSRSGLGFEISFGGTGTFLGPNVDYEITALGRFECDKTVQFVNKSSSLTDSIVSYKWAFGSGASSSNSSLKDPPDITYASFGTKTTALTIESSRGCSVTKLVDVFVNPCCKDTTTLNGQAIASSILCNGENTGLITALARNGSPKYTYSIDSITFQPNPKFPNLKAGNYKIIIRDQKGCEYKVNTFITEPPPILVDAGPDIEVELGQGGMLNGSFQGGTGDGTPLWSPPDSIENVNSFDSKILPLKEKSYTLTVTDENGCTGSDVLNVRVKIIRPVYDPNIIKHNALGENGIFTLSGGRAVKNIKLLEVYDRWGNKMYKGTDLDINDPLEGWNGEFNGKPVNPGVYTWLAVVLFIDDAELVYSGDVTVVR